MNGGYLQSSIMKNPKIGEKDYKYLFEEKLVSWVLHLTSVRVTR
jgi:hypothetical protein